MISRAEPRLRATVISTLSAKFKARVELDAFHVSLLKGLQVSGQGLRIFGNSDPNNHEPGIQPVIGVSEFEFHMGILDFLASPMHVDTVYVKGLQLNLPPREQRGDIKNIGPKDRKIKIVVDKLVCDNTQLIINTLKPGKLPLEFDIEKLKMTSIGPDGPMHFDADLTNPKPVGNVVSSGSFGPWQADSPRDTPVSGVYSFNHADLSTIKGIGGMLSSTGSTPAFSTRLSSMARPIPRIFTWRSAAVRCPCTLIFMPSVDGTSGDTYLQPVNATILTTSLVANGSVVRMKILEATR